MRVKYVFAEALRGLWRNVAMTVAMMITMTVSLTLLGASVLMFLQVRDMKNYFYFRVQVAIYLKDDISGPQRDELRNKLKNDDLVSEVIYEDKDTAYKRFREQFRSAPELVDNTKPGSLPESFRVKPKNPDDFEALRNKYKEQAGVEDIIDQQQVLSKLFRILDGLRGLAIVIALVQGLAALLLVANTTQVAAYSMRREMAIMKLVGAPNWLVHAPFLLGGEMAALASATLATLVLAAAKLFLVDGVGILHIDGVFKPLFTSSILTPWSWLRVALMWPLLWLVASIVSPVCGFVSQRMYLRV